MISFAGGTIATDENFYGRQVELELAIRHGRVWLCGQRRMGKSSLRRKIANVLTHQGWIVLEFDLSAIHPERATPQELFCSFYNKHFETTLHGLGFAQDQFANVAPEEAFERLIGGITNRGLRVSFLWDEAERLLNIAHMDPYFLDVLAGRLPEEHQKFRLILCGTQKLAELYPDNANVSSLIGSFKFVALRGLCNTAASNLLNCQQSGGWNSPLPADIVDAAIAWTGGHPLLLQELGDRLARETNADGQRANNQLLLQCQQAIIGNDGIRRIFADDQRRLTSYQQAILRSLCLHSHEQSVHELIETTRLDERTVKTALGFLNDFGFVSSSERHSLLFRFYPDVLLPNSNESVTDSKKVARIRDFDVFLSYKSSDEKVVTNLAEVLQEVGVKVWLDKWELQPGQAWQAGLEKGIRTSRSVVVVIGSDGVGPWQDLEMRAAITEFVNQKRPVIPVLLPGACHEKIPLLLRSFGWVELGNELSAEILRKLKWGINAEGPNSE